MQKIQPGYQILSLFGANQDQTAPKTNRSLVVSLSAAFLIVLLTALIFNFLLRFLIPASSTALSADYQENYAFVPGQFISQEISRGYLGDYLK